MNDEFEKLTSAWKQLHPGPEPLLQDFTRRSRREAVYTSLICAALLFSGGHLVFTTWRWLRTDVTVSDVLLAYWIVLCASVLVLSAILIINRLRIRSSVRLLSDSPISLLDGTAAIIQRELHGWTGRGPIAAATGFLVFSFGVLHFTGILDWQSHGLPVLAVLLVTAAFGLVRVRLLRRRMNELSKLRSEFERSGT